MSFEARIIQILQKENFCEILHTSCPNIIKKSEKEMISLFIWNIVCYFANNK